MAYMAQVSEEEFRDRFKLAFEIKPDMSSEQFYEILQSTGFKERAAMARVWQLANDARRYAVPASVMEEEYLSGEERSPIEISDDDVERPISADAKIRNDDHDFVGGCEVGDICNDDGSEAPPDASHHQQAQLRHSRGRLPAGIAKGKEEASNGMKSGSSSEAETKSDLNITSQSIPRKGTSAAVKLKNSTALTKTTVTKWIGRLAGGLYVRTMIICDGEKILRDEKGLTAATEVEGSTLESLIAITGDPEARRAGWSGRRVTTNIELVGQPKKRTSDPGDAQRLLSRPDVMIYYGAKLDGEILRPGDYVTVRPGSDETLPKAKSKSESKTAPIWFACIVYIFEDSTTKFPCAHVRWLSHGGDTILDEVAGPRELFLLDRCDDIPLGAVAGLVKVDFVTATGAAEEMFTETNHYFFRQAYCEKNERFRDIDPQERGPSGLILTKDGHCNCCAKHAHRNVLQRTSVIKESGDRVDRISSNGVDYGVDDFVYIVPATPGKQYDIGQIRKFTIDGLSTWAGGQTPSFKVHATIFHRHDELQTPYFEEASRGDVHSVRDNRRLFITDEVVVCSASRLDGRCLVRHVKNIHNLNEYKEMDDAFYVADKLSGSGVKSQPYRLKDLQPLDVYNFHPSEDSEVKSALEMSLKEAFFARNPKLRGMEIFAGAGGLAAGFHRSGAVETRYAIEVDVAAASTFQRNFPHVQVFNQDASVLLRRAIEEGCGHALPPLKDLSGNDLSPMPRPGEIDIITGGPPCQGFSDMNRYKDANSIKNSLLTTYLSYVDFYRPKYFLLENVVGLLNHRLGSKQMDIRRVSGGIENGSTKFILRALTSMGYQVTYSVLKSGEYGTPQSRGRVIFYAALLGYPLPKFPEPTHVFSGPRRNPTRHTRRSAPHLAVTVGDAITDLPPFDWKISGLGRDSLADNAARDRHSLMPQIVVPPKGRGDEKLGEGRPTYQSSPRSEYQRELRRYVPGDILTVVANHFTCRWGDSTMERILKIPMKPGSNHMDLSVEEDMPGLRTTAAAKSNSYYPSRYCRLDFEKSFQTCLCDVDPSGDNGRILHPTQYRILTVREQARAQGFPDSFTWPSNQTPKDMYRQIGNAVAVPLARALGNELLKVLIQKWQRDEATARAAGHVDDENYISLAVDDNDEKWTSGDAEMTDFEKDTIVTAPRLFSA